MPKPKYHIVVCTNARPPGHPKPSCGGAGSQNILMALNMGLMERGFQPGDVLITGSTCLGPCELGPTMRSKNPMSPSFSTNTLKRAPPLSK